MHIVRIQHHLVFGGIRKCHLHFLPLSLFSAFIPSPTIGARNVGNSAIAVYTLDQTEIKEAAALRQKVCSFPPLPTSLGEVNLPGIFIVLTETPDSGEWLRGQQEHREGRETIETGAKRHRGCWSLTVEGQPRACPPCPAHHASLVPIHSPRCQNYIV